MKLLAETEGIWAETAGGVTLAVAQKLIEQGKIDRDGSTVLCITGNGLKTQEALDRQDRPAGRHQARPSTSSRPWSSARRARAWSTSRRPERSPRV